MSKRHNGRIWGGALVCAGFILALSVGGCADRPTPKSTVMDLFSALYSDDTTIVEKNIDFDRAWVTVQNDLREKSDTTGAEIDWPGRLVTSLTGNGKLRDRWLKTQIVIGDTEEFGDSATVEVSFIDRTTRVQFYNKMALVFNGDIWKIVSFKTQL